MRASFPALPVRSLASPLCLLALAAAVSLCIPTTLRAQDATSGAHSAGSVAEGKRVYEKANCVGCHKWHGAGGGGYGGAALSLRATQLTREDIIATISCGRPGTGMPYFQRGAYDDAAHPCYGMGREELGKNIPVEAPGSFLRPGEVAAVADYVLADIKGKGEPNNADCTAFFGAGARVCNIYKTPSPDAATVAKQGG